MPSSADPRPERLISVDIEASGPSPSSGSMIALGACLVVDPETAFYREIQPIQGVPWVAATEAIHGLTREALVGRGVPPAAAMGDLAEWLTQVAADARPVFVGFNAPFDWMFVADYLHRFLGRNPFGVSALDLKSLYMGRDHVARWSDTRHDLIVESYAVVRQGNHNALDDARAQAELAQRLLDIEPAGGQEPAQD